MCLKRCNRADGEWSQVLEDDGTYMYEEVQDARRMTLFKSTRGHATEWADATSWVDARRSKLRVCPAAAPRPPSTLTLCVLTHQPIRVYVISKCLQLSQMSQFIHVPSTLTLSPKQHQRWMKLRASQLLRETSDSSPKIICWSVAANVDAVDGEMLAMFAQLAESLSFYNLRRVHIADTYTSCWWYICITLLIHIHQMCKVHISSSGSFHYGCGGN